MAIPTFITRFLQTLDSEPEGVLALLAPGFRFCVLYAVAGEAREFAGGVEEYRGYLEQRQPDGLLHHVELASACGQTEVVLGYTTKYGERLGTFTMAAQTDDQGRAVRLYASRTTSLSFATAARWPRDAGGER